MKSKTLITFSFAVVFCLIFGISALAQTINGTISGKVSDQQKAAIPGATVTVTNTATGLERSTVTNEAGAFRIGRFAPTTKEGVQVSTAVTNVYKNLHKIQNFVKKRMYFKEKTAYLANNSLLQLKFFFVGNRGIVIV